MYNTAHILYVVISFVVILIFSFAFRKVKEDTRLNILRGIAILTILSHISIVVYDYFVVPATTIGSLGSAIYPYYFCNFIMVLLPITFCGPKVLKKWYPFVLWAAFFGGMITMAVPEFYNGGDIFSLGNFKSFLSHSFMILAFVYAVMSGEYKIQVKTSYIFAIGLLLSGVLGVFTNWLWQISGKGVGNSMYLNAPALDGTIFYGYVMAPIMVAIVYLTAYIIDTIKKHKQKNLAQA
ncbi:MAG: hypothetical protein AB7S44_03455 [Spirochaetales bacterium]